MSRQYSTEEISTALSRSRGVISEAARTLGCSRTTIHERLNNDDGLAGLLERIKVDEREHIECIIYGVVDDTSHKDWFKAVRYYMRVIHGVHEQQVDVTSKGDKIEGFKIILPDADDS